MSCGLLLTLGLDVSLKYLSSPRKKLNLFNSMDHV